MANEVINLWPEVENLPEIKTPVTFLKEQAVLLGARTKNILEGRVIAGSTGEFNYTLNIVAPAMGYSYSVLRIFHDINLYPVTVVFRAEPITCHDEQSFIDALGSCLRSEETVKVIQALLSQSKAAA